MKKIIFVLCVCLLFVGCSSSNSNPLGLDEEEVKNQILNVAESHGLQDVKINFNGSYESYGGLWGFSVTSSNFEDLTYEEMFDLDEDLKDISAGITIDRYRSGDDVYTIYSSSRTISKNGEEIFDDYFNSDSYKEENPDISDEDFDIDDFVVVTDNDTLVKCWIVAEDEIRNQLKSPSGAKFPFASNSEDVTILESVGGDVKRYSVISWVEAENSFGATLRSDFCVLLYEVNGDLEVYSSVIDE